MVTLVIATSPEPQFTYSLRGCNICQGVDYHANLGLCLPSQIQSQSSNYTYRFPHCSPKSHEEPCDHNGYHPQSNGILSPMIEPDPSPPSALMHPTLLEKLRLGAPTSGHIQLSTLNKSQSQHAVVDEFYRLQDSSPFPKLPPYFIHSTTDKLSVREPNEGDDIHNSSSRVNGTIHRSRPELTSKQKCEYMPTSVTAYCLSYLHTHTEDLGHGLLPCTSVMYVHNTCFKWVFTSLVPRPHPAFRRLLFRTASDGRG